MPKIYGINNYYINCPDTSSNILGGGCISWTEYKGQLNLGRVVNFICSTNYNGTKNHSTLGVGYTEEQSGSVKIISYYDLYTCSVRSSSYDDYKIHYWYETNYNITKVQGTIYIDW